MGENEITTLINKNSPLKKNFINVKSESSDVIQFIICDEGRQQQRKGVKLHAITNVQWSEWNSVKRKFFSCPPTAYFVDVSYQHQHFHFYSSPSHSWWSAERKKQNIMFQLTISHRLRHMIAWLLRLRNVYLPRPRSVSGKYIKASSNTTRVRTVLLEVKIINLCWIITHKFHLLSRYSARTRNIICLFCNLFTE